MDKTASQILSLFESEENIQVLVDILTDTALLFSKKFKSIGAEIDTGGRAISIRQISVPPILYAKAEYSIFFPATDLQTEIKTINKIMRKLKKSITLTKGKLKESREVVYDGKMISSAAQLHIYSSQQINSFLTNYMLSILDINTLTRFRSAENNLVIRVNPSFFILPFDVLRMYKRNYIKNINISELTKMVCDEILNTSDQVIKSLRLIEF